MGSKGSNTTTTQSTNVTTPDSAAYQQYLNDLSRASSVASLPYTPYSNELVAGINQQQTTGIGNINTNANSAAPYIAAAGALAGSAAMPITAAQIQSYMNPFTQNVVNSTQAQFNNQNQQQQQSLVGNAASQGALGGDRVAVAQANLANQQNLAQAPVIAGLESSGYTTAQQMAQAEQQAMLSGAYGLAGIGTGGQAAALQGATAQIQAGTLQQQTQQAQDLAAYQQYQIAQAFPYQQAGWLAGIDTGVGSQMGGTSTGAGTQTAPAPSQFGQIAGLGLTAAALLAARGGRIPHFDLGGTVPYGGGVGGPFSSVNGFMPAAPQFQLGAGAPRPQPMQFPQQPAQQSTNPFDLMKQVGSAAQGFRSLRDSMGHQDTPAEDYGDDEASGGRVRGYDDGGGVDSFDDRFYAPPPSSVIFAPPAQQPANGIPPVTPNDRSIDATDIVIPDGPGGIGLGAKYEPTNAALNADAGSPSSDGSLPPIITQGPQDAQGQGGLPKSAMAYDQPQGGGSSGAAPAGPSNALDNAAYNQPAPPLQIAPNQGGQRLDQPSNFKGLLGTGLVPNDWRGAMLAAGAGMMASRSPFALNAIGEGVQQGISQYGKEKQQAIQQAQAQSEIDYKKAAVDHLMSQTKLVGAQIAKATAEAPFAGQQAEANVAATKARTGYETAQTGEITARTPYAGPQAAANVAAAQARAGLEGAQAANVNAKTPLEAGNLQSEIDVRNAQAAYTRAHSLAEISTLFNPVKIGVDRRTGYDVYAIKDPYNQSMRIIDPQTGRLGPVTSLSGQSNPAPSAPVGAQPQPQNTGLGYPQLVPGAFTPQPAPAGGGVTPAAVTVPQAPPVQPAQNAEPIPAAPAAPMPPTYADYHNQKPLEAPQLGPNEYPLIMNPRSAPIAQEYSKKLLDTTREDAAAAGNVKFQLTQMEGALDKLPEKGWLSPGPGLAQRANALKVINGVKQILGGDPNDQRTIAATEELNKLSTRMGFDLARTLGAREAQMIVQQAIAAVPSGEMTRYGAIKIMSGLRAAAQRQQDLDTFVQSWAQNHQGDTMGAVAYFNQARPPEWYAKMGEYEAARYPQNAANWSGRADFEQSPKGTFFKRPNGELVVRD